MVLLLRRNIIALSAIFLLFLYLTDALETTTMTESDEDDSSSEETIEDSNEAARRKRHAPAIVTTSDTMADEEPRAGIPGLPDAATILRIAEILQTVGEKVIPLLVQGNAYATERIGQDIQFLNTFKKDIDQFTTQRAVGNTMRSSRIA